MRVVTGKVGFHQIVGYELCLGLLTAERLAGLGNKSADLIRMVSRHAVNLSPTESLQYLGSLKVSGLQNLHGWVNLRDFFDY